MLLARLAMLEERFRAYIDACSNHDWDTVRSYFGEHLVFNDERRTSDSFVADLIALAVEDPTVRWSILMCDCSEDSVVASLLFENGERAAVGHAHYWTDGNLITELRVP